MFEHCMYFNTTSLARKLEREWTVAFNSFGLTPSQAFLLRVVLFKQTALQSELASEMNISRSTATRTLDGLQKLGYVIRTTSDTDGRESIIKPTAKALKIADSLNRSSGEVTKKLKGLLGESAFVMTVSDVRKVSELL
jgi:DNA-binding MarR family transcriptional regulator